jgi:hypothetical protein
MVLNRHLHTITQQVSDLGSAVGVITQQVVCHDLGPGSQGEGEKYNNHASGKK